MQLLKAIKEFRTKRVAQLTLPRSAALEEACKKFEVARERTEDDVARIERILTAFKAFEAASLNRRDMRLIVAAIGNSPLIAGTEVLGILAEIERRGDGRLVRAVFKALLASYRERSIRVTLRAFVVRHLHALPSNILRFSKQSGILEGDKHIEVLSESLVKSGDIYSFCLVCGLTTNILATSYGTELKLASIRASLETMNAKTIHRMLSWAFDGMSGVPLGDFYEVALSPFEAKSPPSDVQKVLTIALVTKFGDPRIDAWPGLTGRDGQDRKNACVATLKRWLSIEYLDLFIRIIEATAVDHQFKPRKSFWLRYFEKGVISDLTLILASDANAVARKARGQSADSEYMKWASLNLALPDQSVLLMRLGDLVIAEWSHNGAMRFWKADSNAAPEFHLANYNGADLRSGSIKVKVGGDYRGAIVHTPNGQWMRWASNAIEFHTGVRT